MSTIRHCPQCSSPLPPDAPEGVCPKCVMGLGFANSGGDPRFAQTAARAGHFNPPKPGVLDEHFPQLEILDLIGQGGMGAVYKARQRGLDRLVALKILAPETSGDPAFAERFSREARALARLNHPNIVNVYDSGQAGGYYFLLMEYVDGVNLRQTLEAKTLAAEEALAIVPQICEALQFAHNAGVVHRDIKPENVLLDKAGNVKVADFGLAKLAGQAGDDFALTATHQVMGTPRYMAPEQIEGSRGVDHRADIYSLGVVFYELLTGELPLGRFAVPSATAGVDARLDEVVLRTLEKDPQRRYQQVGQVKTDVESIHHPAPAYNQHNYEFRSKATVFGLPLVHIANGIDPATGKRRVAKGIIAIGDTAVGVVAMGGVACGIISFGGVAAGLISFGGVSLGLLLAFGGAALGCGISTGGFAVGLYANGGLAAGGHAMGGLALGYNAQGGLAIGYHAVGGQAIGVFAEGAGARSPEAVQAINNPQESIPFWFYLIPLVAVAVYCKWFFSWLFKGAAQQPDMETVDDDDWSPEAHFPPAAHHRSPSRWHVGCVILVVAVLLGFPLLAVLAYFFSASRMVESNPATDSVVEVEEPILELQTATPNPYWTRTEDGPTVTRQFADLLILHDTQTIKLNRILRSSYRQYLALEEQHLDREWNEAGRQIVTIDPFVDDILKLENEFWTAADEALNVRQQHLARANLRLFPRKITGQVFEPNSYLLGWGGQGEVQLTFWKVGHWHHWEAKYGSLQIAGRGPELPVALRPYRKERADAEAPSNPESSTE